MPVPIPRRASLLVLLLPVLLILTCGADAAPVPGFERCPQLFPQRRPVAAPEPGWRAVGLCANHFAVLASGRTKTPLLVVERLNRAMLQDAKGEARSDEFYADPRLPPGERAELVDYRGSGLDRGHLANAADQPDRDSMIQSFALSNMVPQDPQSNRKGAWLKAEKDTRKYVLRRAEGDVYVFSGPLFRGPLRTIGPDRVWVPSHLFKLVYDERAGRAWAFIVANGPDERLGAPVGYEDFVRETGWRLLQGPAAAPR
ncbi:DNA/RNA non-specific endonuclease [Pelomonas sp. KK5]|uniref:DNA/RNA non-specific endonuclease n=1 Tax=Pelomonas sp. KK5 TaxID=1855730 RepID=UPI00097C23F6|nr:DNA/RNA non-specific endonuclease [Pelomonas sp. KK5]